jgi:hypothetical protein
VKLFLLINFFCHHDELGLFTDSSSEITMKLCISETVGRAPWMDHQSVALPLSLQGTTNTAQMLTDFHASSGIPTHNPIVQEALTARPL